MSEEKFFGNVRETLYTYAPEVPADAYSRMRRRLWLSQFLQFSAGRLNAWYLLCAGVLTAGGLMMLPGDSSQALRSGAYESNIPELQLVAGAAQSCVTTPARVNAHRACSTTATVASLQSQPALTGPAAIDEVSESAVTGENTGDTPVGEIQVIQETTPDVAPALAPKKGKRLSPKILRDKNR
ncbi:MAG: hypothetical protein ACK500_06460 [Flavobacteriales bacterium]|jgi:hypothetical protein